jgi:hypothetical protein
MCPSRTQHPSSAHMVSHSLLYTHMVSPPPPHRQHGVDVGVAQLAQRQRPAVRLDHLLHQRTPRSSSHTLPQQAMACSSNMCVRGCVRGGQVGGSRAGSSSGWEGRWLLLCSCTLQPNTMAAHGVRGQGTGWRVGWVEGIRGQPALTIQHSSDMALLFAMVRHQLLRREHLMCDLRKAVQACCSKPTGSFPGGMQQQQRCLVCGQQLGRVRCCCCCSADESPPWTRL